MHETKVNTENADVTSSASKKTAPRRYWYRPEVVSQPPLILVSTNIGLGLDHTLYAQLQRPNGDRAECDIETVLRVIDMIQKPGRTKILAGAEDQYDLPLGALMGPDLSPATDATGGQQ